MITNEQVKAELKPSAKMQAVIDTINKDYPSGYFSGEFDNGDIECKGFARKVYYLYFGKKQSQAEYYWTANSSENAKADNSLITNEKNMSLLIPALPVCTLMRVLTQSGKYHSIIISARNSTQVQVYDANRVGSSEGEYNKISLETMSYAKFAETFPKIIYFSQGRAYSSSLTGTSYFPMQSETSVYVGTNNEVKIKLSVDQNVSATFSGAASNQVKNDYKIWLYGEQKTGNNFNVNQINKDTYFSVTSNSFNKNIKISSGFFQFIYAKVEIGTGSNTYSAHNFYWVMTYAGNSYTGQ